MYSMIIVKQSGTVTNNLDLYQRQGSCEDFGYISLQTTSKCLKLYHTEMSWMTANSTCASAGGKLFGITTADMFDDVLNVTSRKDPTFQNFFIDGNDIASENNWVLSDGTPILHLPWGKFQPGLGRDENCLLVIGNFYHDAPCYTMEFKFICEKQFIISL
ncbi:C-type lectin domain family 3 member A-like [Saccostrea cucullata]|uniref:C-type lectin domain family 3 member A-like n=1 Tax=Saccostrea cuccullata TaxID=36930 RepID=UPI002ED64D55